MIMIVPNICRRVGGTCNMKYENIRLVTNWTDSNGARMLFVKVLRGRGYGITKHIMYVGT